MKAHFIVKASRNTEARMNMTAEERRNSLAAATEDVACKGQIFLYDSLDGQEMGTRVNNRMKMVGEHFEGQELSDNERAVVDVYSGKEDRYSFKTSTIDGNKTIEMRQGHPNKAGTKHSIYRHLNTESGYYTVDEIALIPQIIAEGSRDVIDKKAVYTMYKDGIRYRVVTDIKGNKEVFNTFYTNRKAASSTSQKTQLSARTSENTAYSGTKVRIGNNSTKDADLKNVNEGDFSSREVATPARKTATELAAERTQLYRNTAENAAKSVGEEVTVIEDIEDITDDNPALQLKKRGAKGWYDPERGKVVINLSAHRDAADVVETVLHETVGHKGIEEMMGKERFERMIDEVWSHAPDDVRQVETKNCMKVAIM